MDFAIGQKGEMMDDLISRRVAIDAIKNICEECDSDYCGDCRVSFPGRKDCEKVLEGLPSAQPEPRKGQWIYGEDDVAMCDGYHCSECGFFVPWDYKRKFIDFIKDYNFCPSCGRPMLKEGEG